jgi:hypothetical protein
VPGIFERPKPAQVLELAILERSQEQIVGDAGGERDIVGEASRITVYEHEHVTRAPEGATSPRPS